MGFRDTGNNRQQYGGQQQYDDQAVYPDYPDDQYPDENWVEPPQQRQHQLELQPPQRTAGYAAPRQQQRDDWARPRQAPPQQQGRQQAQRPPQQQQSAGRFQGTGQQRGGQQQQRRPPQAGTGRFSGVRANAEQFPVPLPGNYFFQFLSNRVTNGTGSEYYNATLLVLDSDNNSHPLGSKCTFLQGLSGDQFRMGAPRMLRLLMGMLGYTEEQDFKWEFQDWEQLLERMHDGDNFLRGEASRARVIPAKKEGFVEWYWEPCEPHEVPELPADAA